MEQLICPSSPKMSIQNWSLFSDMQLFAKCDAASDATILPWGKKKVQQLHVAVHTPKKKQAV